jgi:MoaA/NifB/PqqE/SkfB family radical SAM enzyme
MGYEETNLDLNTVKVILPERILQDVKNILVNGNFGDFVMNPQSVEILEYLRNSSSAQINVHTNGSARDRDFWNSLGKIDDLQVTFNVDGLADTNHLYRQDTKFETIMKNAQIFIDAGGRAVWQATVFEHNRHQLLEIEALAKKMRFVEVIFRETGRNHGPVYNRQGKKIHWISNDWKWPAQIDKQFIEQYRSEVLNLPDQNLIKTRKIPNRKYFKKYYQPNCWAVKEKSIYIAADGYVYPCCWLGHNPKKYKGINMMSQWNDEIVKYTYNNHAPTVGLEAAVEWFESVAATWGTENQLGACSHFCGK